MKHKTEKPKRKMTIKISPERAKELLKDTRGGPVVVGEGKWKRTKKRYYRAIIKADKK